MLIGIIQSGAVTRGQQLVVMPNKVRITVNKQNLCYLVIIQTPVEVLSVLRNEDEIHSGYSGDNVKLKLKGVEEEVSC